MLLKESAILKIILYLLYGRGISRLLHYDHFSMPVLWLRKIVVPRLAHEGFVAQTPFRGSLDAVARSIP